MEADLEKLCLPLQEGKSREILCRDSARPEKPC
jgi:hypothetical protein